MAAGLSDKLASFCGAVFALSTCSGVGVAGLIVGGAAAALTLPSIYSQIRRSRKPSLNNTINTTARSIEQNWHEWAKTGNMAQETIGPAVAALEDILPKLSPNSNIIMRHNRDAEIITSVFLEDAATRHPNDFGHFSNDPQVRVNRHFFSTVVSRSLQTVWGDPNTEAALQPLFQQEVLKRLEDEADKSDALAIEIDSLLKLLKHNLHVDEAILHAKLRSAEDVQDAWQRLMPEFPFVGRSHELDYLIGFALGKPDHRPFTWQVLFGPHATGKTRLAREWLSALSRQDPKWVGGFAPQDPADLLSISELEPVVPTAIIIDDAQSLGDELWKFLGKATRWQTSSVPVRVLLIAHSDLDVPLLENFSQRELLVSLRQSRQLKEGDVRTVLKPRRGANSRVSIGGCALRPISSEEEQNALVQAAAAKDGNEIGDAQLAQIRSAAAGRTAFLLLAGYEPDQWMGLLDGYSRTVAAQAQSCFAPSRDGLKLLAASILAGPFPDKIRVRIAPMAAPPQKLEWLFPFARKRISDEVPRFEPDLLGYHALGPTLEHFSKSEIEKFGEVLLEINAPRYVDQISNCFASIDLAYNYYNLFFDDEDAEAASFARILDALIEVLVKNSNHRINTKSAKISYCRRDAIFACLSVASDWGEEKIAGLFIESLRFLPRDGFADILTCAVQEIGIKEETKTQWLALISAYTSPLGALAKSKVGDLKLRTRDYREEEGANQLASSLNGKNGFLRVFAAYELSEWLRDTFVLSGEPKFKDCRLRGGILEMLRSQSPTEEHAASWCLKQSLINHETKLRDDVAEIPEEEINYIFARLETWARNPDDSIAMGQHVQVLAHQFSTYWPELGAEAWLRGEAEPSTFFDRNKHHDIEHLMAILADLDVEMLDASKSITTLVIEHATLFLTRAGLFHPKFACCLDEWRKYKDWDPSFMSVIWGLVTSPEPSAREYLLRIVAEVPDKSGIVPFVCACALCCGEAKILEDVKTFTAELNPSLDISSLSKELLEHKRGDPWSGRSATILLKHLADDRIRRGGHLVHKLKAKDKTGRWAYYFVYVRPKFENKFMGAIDGDGIIDLENYGEIIASCYGEVPNEDVVRFLREEYGFDVLKRKV